MILPTVTAKVADGVLGAFAATISLVLLGQSNQMNWRTQRYLASFGGIASVPFQLFLQTLNSKALPNEEIQYSNGLLAGKVRCYIFALRPDAQSAGFLKRQIGNRLNAAVKLLATVITRVADGAIGAVAAVLAVATLGSFKNVNLVAYQGLQVADLPGNIACDLIGLLNGK